MQGLLGKVALVTGAAHGQGRAHAVRLARDGAELILLDVCEQVAETGYPLGDRGELEATAELVRNEGRQALPIVADVRNAEDLRRGFDDSGEIFSRLDIIVANAAISGHSRFLSYDHARWDAIIDINLTGTFKVLQTFVPRMIGAGNGGSIVMMSSVAGLKGVPFTSAYVASKHAIQGLMKVLALELAEHAIRVNTLNPGAVATPMTTDGALSALFEGGDAASELFHDSYNPALALPEGGFMGAEHVTAALSWLVSEQARFVTGIAIPIEAGALLR